MGPCPQAAATVDVYLDEMAFLVGPSGSEKTTLLSVIAGLLDSSGGDAEVLGEWMEQLPSQQRIRFRRTTGTHDKKPDETRYPCYGDRHPRRHRLLHLTSQPELSTGCACG